jgi:hypothetical protein
LAISISLMPGPYDPGVNKSDALVHHPPEQRDRRALILNSLCFGGALPPFKLSYRLVRIATGQCLFGEIKAGCGKDERWLKVATVFLQHFLRRE